MKHIKYKVVQKALDKDYFVSAVVSKRAQVIYKPYEWSHTPEFLAERGYYLCVFRTLKHAYSFARNHFPRLKIFKCQVEGKHRILKLPFMLSNNITYGIVDPKDHLDQRFPKGTEMWEHVKLLEEVKE